MWSEQLTDAKIVEARPHSRYDQPFDADLDTRRTFRKGAEGFEGQVRNLDAKAVEDRALHLGTKTFMHLMRRQETELDRRGAELNARAAPEPLTNMAEHELRLRARQPALIVEHGPEIVGVTPALGEYGSPVHEGDHRANRAAQDAQHTGSVLGPKVEQDADQARRDNAAYAAG